MSAFFSYLVLALFPALIILIPEPTAARWGAQNKSFYLPPDVRLRSEKNGRYVWILKYFFLSLLVLKLARVFRLPPATVGLTFQPFFRLLLTGVAGGLFLALCRAALRSALPVLPKIEQQYDLLHGPVMFWQTIFLLGGCAEELWRALSIVALQESGHTLSFALVATTLSFAFGRTGGIPVRIHGDIVDVAAEAATGLVLGAIFIQSHSVIAPFIASVLYYTFEFYSLRRRFGPNCR